MANIAETRLYIDERIDNQSIPQFSRIIAASETTSDQQKQAQYILRTALRIANFYDFCAETGNPEYCRAAEEHEEELYELVGPEVTADLQAIKAEIITFFDYERDVWNRVQAGEKITEKEIAEFMRQKSSDAIYYGRLLRIYTGDVDVTPVIYANMQLLDYRTDVQEYDKDRAENAPNVLFMLLSRHVPLEEIPDTQKQALQLATSVQATDIIVHAVRDIYRSAQQVPVHGYEFLYDEIEEKYKSLLKEVDIGSV